MQPLYYDSLTNDCSETSRFFVHPKHSAQPLYEICEQICVCISFRSTGLHLWYLLKDWNVNSNIYKHFFYYWNYLIIWQWNCTVNMEHWQRCAGGQLIVQEVHIFTCWQMDLWGRSWIKRWGHTSWALQFDLKGVRWRVQQQNSCLSYVKWHISEA